jgi:hypothetical protein
VDASRFNTISYNARSGGGGNCTSVPPDASSLSHITCQRCPVGRSELCRDDAALRELVGTWHRLTPSVRDAIMELVRGRG